jgi:enoyl-[acyl-carrier protein] reductase I
MVAYVTANAPLPQELTATEVGLAMAFLCSPMASGVTGTTLYVDKGFHTMGMALGQ